MEPKVKFVVHGLYTGLEEGTYRVTIGVVDQMRTCHAIFKNESGEDIPLIFEGGPLEKQLGCEYFNDGDQFNVTIKDKGNTQEYFRII